MNTCLNCKHAQWERTSNGRAHPHKAGWCSWTKVVYVPLVNSKEPMTLRGGYIWRKTPHEKCPTFHPIESC